MSQAVRHSDVGINGSIRIRITEDMTTEALHYRDRETDRTESAAKG